MNLLKTFPVAVALATLAFGSSALAQKQTIAAKVYADNWFEFYVDGEVVMTDSVPITTEMSFNTEVFSFETELPAQLAFHVMDYKEDDSGYEYITSSTKRQQLGGGGFMAEFTNASGEVLAATNSDWLCQVIHQAPLDEGCASDTQSCTANILPLPAGWSSASFDDSDWPAAVVHSDRAVGPKREHGRLSWDSESQFIWGEDLKIDNTILCRLTLSEI